MLEITNRTRGPVSLVVRSRRGPSSRQFTTLTILGIGAGCNVVRIEDEAATEYIEKARREKLISVRVLPEPHSEGVN